MSIDVDIVPKRRGIGIDRSYEGVHPFPTAGSKEVGLKVESVYRDEQSRWIVAVAESRDRRAFKRLFNYFGPRIKGFCQNNGSTADRADEVVQEAFVNIWRKAYLFDPKKASAGAGIFAIASNSGFDLIR